MTPALGLLRHWLCQTLCIVVRAYLLIDKSIFRLLAMFFQWISSLKRKKLTKNQKMIAALGLFITTGFTIYAASYFPYYVYILDKLNLRPFILPNIMCNNCSHFPAAYIIHNRTLCDEPPFLLVIVISFHANVNARNAIRKSWGSVKHHKGHRIQTVFTFGQHADKNFNYQLVYEQQHFNDIVQAKFDDNYRTLTEKSMMGLKWATQHCSGAKYILKTDDDSFNHLKRFVDYLLLVEQEKFVGGYCFTVMPDRRTGSKYYVPASIYPDTYYPTYCAGPGYVLSQAAAKVITEIAPNVVYLPMEDVYIAGLCRAAAGIQYTEIPGVIISRDQMSPCDMWTWAKNTHNIVPEDQHMLWARAMEGEAKKDCSGKAIGNAFTILIFLLVWARLLFWLFCQNVGQCVLLGG